VIVFISIGNSDDKLTQRRWSQYVKRVDVLLELCDPIHGRWFSEPDSPYQNACWCVEFSGTPGISEIEWIQRVRQSLRSIAAEFDQDSIAWAEVHQTEFLSGRPE
jgi:hypothetical protein